MDKLLTKLNYKGDTRVCILGGNGSLIKTLSKSFRETRIDKAIDPKYLYNFFIIFAETSEDVERTFPAAVHNLYEDGIIWYMYPKTPGQDKEKALTRNTGWDSCKDSGFDAVRHICVDEQISATRFRNKKFIRRRDKK